jgi:pimeloyl-ACP methyl ester carboxylesterase
MEFYFFHLEHGRAYQQGIVGSKLVILEKCGHAPPFEKPQETSRVIVDFLKN